MIEADKVDPLATDVVKVCVVGFMVDLDVVDDID